MVYNIIVSPKAQIEIENAAEYYAERSNSMPVKFIDTIQDTYRMLSLNPNYKNSYKSFRSVTVKGFPFLLFFIIDDYSETVLIISCFHTAQNPDKYPL